MGFFLLSTIFIFHNYILICNTRVTCIDNLIPSFTEVTAKKKMNPPTSTNEQVFCCEMINHDADEKYRRSTREFVPAEKKDDMYWFKRVKNNASVRKSRMKKQAMDNVLRKKMMLLWSENLQLRSELTNTLNTIFHRRPSQNRNISSMTPVMKEEEPYESVRNFNKYTI